MGNEEAIKDVLAQFVRLRQLGWSREQAWSKIDPQTQVWAPQEREQLLGLLQRWENTEGRNYQRTPTRDPFQEQSDPYGTNPARPDPPITQPVSRSVRRIKRIESQPAPGQRAPSTGPTCPVCGMTNRPGEVFCVDCGNPLSTGAHPGGTQRLGFTEPKEGTYFGDDMVVVFRVQDSNEMIRVNPRKDDTVIGRRAPDSAVLPDVDLSPFNADHKGVSRMHAALRRQGVTLVLTDMGSLNHTHINGQRIHANEVRVVKNGDELQFGQLRVNVYFEQT